MKRIPPSEVMKQEADAILEGYLEEGPPLEALARLGARYMLQVALEEEVTAFLGRGHYQHGSHRRGDPGLPRARAGRMPNAKIDAPGKFLAKRDATAGVPTLTKIADLVYT